MAFPFAQLLVDYLHKGAASESRPAIIDIDDDIPILRQPLKKAVSSKLIPYIMGFRTAIDFHHYRVSFCRIKIERFDHHSIKGDAIRGLELKKCLRRIPMRLYKFANSMVVFEQL